MEGGVSWFDLDKLDTLVSSCDKSDISATSSSASSPDEVESGSSSEFMEEVWSDDVESAFYEALEIFPGQNNKKRIRISDGKAYGRNYLIACYIKKKCGKVRNVKQISSHLQVVTRRQKLHARASLPSQVKF
uniref:TEA domain-containing protein n=1 Tax=Acrobeloides nanus TaxID=290746 RepID=A0A914CI48_9BILA